MVDLGSMVLSWLFYFRLCTVACCIFHEVTCGKQRTCLQTLCIHEGRRRPDNSIFSQVGMKWVSPGTICDMMVIYFKCFGNSFRGRAVWRIVCLSLLWIVWKERNARIFENTWRMSDSLWDLLHFFVSFWAYCTYTFKPYPLSVIQLSWLSIRTRQGWVIGAAVGLLV